MSTVLVIGSGGREHALAWKLAQSPQVTRLILAPGNDGMPASWERWKFSVAKDEFNELADRARAENVDLVVVGPDNPLADGLVDVLESYGIAAFGPTAAAARIEASKTFAKGIMQAAGVPTARYFVASSISEAQKILTSLPWPPQMGHGWVVKADGLALGKGVVVCAKISEAFAAVEALMPISGQVLIEERLQGEELSWFAFCDGERCALFEPARDYKRLRDGNEGPNTGGMGSFSPVPGVTEALAAQVRETVFLPTLLEMKRRGHPFRGLLYAGLMADLGRSRLWVIEFNARFGDPETQALMPRFEGDILPWFEACARGDLSELPVAVPFVSDASVYVVGAAEGYPEQPVKGAQIEDLANDAEGLFYAGVKKVGEHLTASGGRVLGAFGIAPELEFAREKAYARLSQVRFEGMQYRTDIAAPGGRDTGGWDK